MKAVRGVDRYGLAIGHAGSHVLKPAVKFALGQVVVTPTVSDALAASGQTLDELLRRHQSGDWGEVSAHQRRLNEQALDAAYSLQSTYRTAAGAQVTVVTRGDRSATLVHLDPRG
jgi:hypothetical protein